MVASITEQVLSFVCMYNFVPYCDSWNLFKKKYYSKNVWKNYTW